MTYRATSASRSNLPEKCWLKSRGCFSAFDALQPNATRQRSHIPCSADAAKADAVRLGTEQATASCLLRRRSDRREITSPKVSEEERPTESDLARQQLGPRRVPGAPDPAKMTPQRKKKTLEVGDFDGHTAWCTRELKRARELRHARQIESVGEHHLRKREFGPCSSNERSNRCRIGIRHLPSRRAP